LEGTLKIKDIFKTAIKAGVKNDPSETTGRWSEFKDSDILCGNSELNVKRVAVGIDIESEEILIVSRLNDKGRAIDLVIAHHPEGKGLYHLYSMVKIQEEMLIKSGVNLSSAEVIIGESYSKYKKAYTSLNYNRAVESAKLMNINFMNIHTPADNMVHSYIMRLMDEKKPKTLKDIIIVLSEEEEYKNAEKLGAGPVIISGKPEYRAGKIYVDMTGGVEASKKIYKAMEQAGVSTIIGMHMSEEHLEEAKKNNINVIMAGHMASDTLGINLILDEIEKIEPFEEVVEMSGFRRVKRV
jgi:putative NIF3 family GTP cyclohydrolase 1 type 2